MNKSAIRVVSAVLLLAGPHITAAGDRLFGYWMWTPGGAPPEYYGNPRDACLALLRQLEHTTAPDASYRGVKKGTSFDTTNNYTCLWKHDQTGDKEESLDALHGRYTCPTNAHALTLNNSGKVADYRCECDSGTCVSVSPPAPDTSKRCKPATPPPPSAPVSIVQAAVISNANQQMAANLLTALDYNAVAQELKATEDCSFKKKDFYKGGASDVNIGFLCGFRDGDEAAANNIAGYGGTPTGFVWHHNLDLGRMQLVTKAAHAACGSHIGGVAAWKEALGLPDYPLHLPPLQ
jgi:hypothetical protein